MIESPMYDEIMEEGRIEIKRKDIRIVLAKRFGSKAANEFAEPLDRISKLKQLSKVFGIALKGRSLTEFRKAVAKAATK